MPVNGQAFARFVERAGKRIPDPVIIFMAFYPLAFLLTVFMAGYSFETVGAGGEAVQHQILGMHQAEHMRWIFDNALLRNWLGFGGGVLGVILAFMRKYRPDMAFGDMLLVMMPYSIAFLGVWTLLLVAFFTLGIPLGV